MIYDCKIHTALYTAFPVYQEVSNSSSSIKASFVTTLGNAKLIKVGGVHWDGVGGEKVSFIWHVGMTNSGRFGI